MKKIIIVILIFSLNTLYSQKIEIDRDSILIGEQVNIKILNPLNTKNLWPEFKDTLVSGLEILNSKKDTVDGFIIQNVTVTSWDSGTYQIPHIAFSNKTISNSINLYVNSIKIESDAELKDIKSPKKAPINWIDIYPWIIILLVVILLLYFIKKYFTKNNKNQKVKKTKIVVPEDIIALENLQKTEEKKLWQNGYIKEYHSEISEIIRRYTEDRYSFNALEITTWEIITLLKDKIEEKELNKLTIILERSDLAKFAKNKPSKEKNIESIELAKTFINATKRTKNDRAL